MKCVIFAVILLGMQTSTTPPQKAADSAAHVRQRSKNQSNPNHSPAPHTGVGVVENPTQQIEDKSSGTGAGNTERGVEVTHLPPVTVNPPKRDLADWGYWAFSGLLVVVGILQVVLLCWTLRAARQQASEMHRQRLVMRGQLQAMRGQLKEMQTGGEQTDALIEQTKIQAVKMGVAADAAKKSAETFLLSERAWIQVNITKQPIIQRDGQTIQRVWFWPDVINVGRTPAKITKVIFVTCQMPKPLGNYGQMPPSLPAEPIYDADNERRVIGVERDAILAPSMGINPIPIEVRGQEFIAITQRKITLYVYGYVDYFDVAGESHQTKFCEMYWVYPGSNDPNPEGFITAGNTPAAYTHCT